MSYKVAILGASAKEDRYSYKAFKMLKEHGHQVFPVHPTLGKLEGEKVYSKLSEIPEKIHSLTLYVGPQISMAAEKEILEIAPQRVIMNPGAENPVLAEKLRAAGVEVVEGCTLVMLRTNQF